MSTLICIPTYNEIDSLPRIIERVRTTAPKVDILVIDDASPDGTGELADSIAVDDPQIQVLHRHEKNGLGRAYMDGFAWARDRGYEWVVEMDADGSHRPEQLPNLLHRATGPMRPDLVIGSRWVRGGEVVNWPAYREFLSRGGNLYVRLWLGMPVNDATAGFRVYRMDALEKLDWDAVESRGYFFQVDMTRKFVEMGATIEEVPISFVEREAGESKMSGDIVREAMLRTTKLGLAKRGAQLKGLAQRIMR